jgi:mediator of RNA polymerase II transcription subunit 17
VRVRVKKDNKLIGSSQLSQFVAAADDSIEKRILQARDTLFEEELFHELNREARILASSGVTTHLNLIQFEYDEGEEILLDLVDLDDMPEETESTQRTQDHDTIAEATAYSLRILLSYAHRQNLQRRTQFPPPLTPQRRPTPQYQLLRPILSYLQHDSHVQSLQSFLRDIYRVLKSAGLQSHYTGAVFSSLKLSRKSNTSTVESLVGRFLEPLETKFSGTMANQTSIFNVRVHTNRPDSSLRSSTLGTEYEFSIRLPNFPYTQPPSRMGLKSEVESLLIHLTTVDLTTFITSVSSRNAANTSPPEKQPLVWEAPFAHYGEVIATAPGSNQAKKLCVHLSRRELSLRTSWLERSESVESGIEEEEDEVNVQRPVGKLLYTWKIDDGAQKTLEDVIADVSRDWEI